VLGLQSQQGKQVTEGGSLNVELIMIAKGQDQAERCGMLSATACQSRKKASFQMLQHVPSRFLQTYRRYLPYCRANGQSFTRDWQPAQEGCRSCSRGV